MLPSGSRPPSYTHPGGHQAPTIAGDIIAKTRASYLKRQREIAKKVQRQAKLQRRADKRASATAGEPTDPTPDQPDTVEDQAQTADRPESPS